MRVNGASVLAYPNLQEQLESVFPQGCYLLPSSLHEMIIIPKDLGMTPKEMGEMVREVNQKEGSPVTKSCQTGYMSLTERNGSCVRYRNP